MPVALRFSLSAILLLLLYMFLGMLGFHPENTELIPVLIEKTL